MHVPPSRHKQETFFMTLQFISFCIGRIMLFCQAINITECLSIIKPFEGFGSKKTPGPNANSVVRVVKLRLSLPSPGVRQLHLLQSSEVHVFQRKVEIVPYRHLIFSWCSLLHVFFFFRLIFNTLQRYLHWKKSLSHTTISNSILDVILIDNINSCILGATRGFARKKPLVKFVPSALSPSFGGLV